MSDDRFSFFYIKGSSSGIRNRNRNIGHWTLLQTKENNDNCAETRVIDQWFPTFLPSRPSYQNLESQTTT